MLSNQRNATDFPDTGKAETLGRNLSKDETNGVQLLEIYNRK